MDRLTWRLALLLVASVAAGACTTNDATTTTPSTTPTAITESFTGTLNLNGTHSDAQSYPFTVTAAGNVSATLTSLGADNPPKIGLSLGTWNGSSCQIVIANDAAVLGTTVLGTASAAGSLCIRVYDVGGVVDPLPYQVQVTHF